MNKFTSWITSAVDYVKDQFGSKGEAPSTIALRNHDSHDLKDQMLHSNFDAFAKWFDEGDNHQPVVIPEFKDTGKLYKVVAPQFKIPDPDNAEQVELYKWWTEGRPNRPNSWEASSLNEVYQSLDTKYGPLWWIKRPREVISPEERQQYTAAIEAESNIHQSYDDEDQEMLVRLMKIRNSLWT